MMLSLYHFEALVGNRKLQISAPAAGIRRCGPSRFFCDAIEFNVVTTKRNRLAFIKRARHQESDNFRPPRWLDALGVVVH